MPTNQIESRVLTSQLPTVTDSDGSQWVQLFRPGMNLARDGRTIPSSLTLLQ